MLWALVQVMRRWLDMGVDGFRLDAMPYLCEREGTNNENLPETHAIIKQMRAELDAYAPGKVLLAEANQWPEDVSAYFGDGDECHMAYHFPLMPRIYMAIAQEDRFPIADILRQTPEIPANCQWAMFLRNHDELTLEMVTDVERDYLWSTYAADPRARINLGIRRRLAPLMDNDRRKIELMNSMLMSMPGHADHLLRRRDRHGRQHLSRRPQRRAHADAMDARPQRRIFALRSGAALSAAHHGPGLRLPAVNVEAQSRSPSSLLSWMKRLIGVRESSKVFGRGTLTFIRPGQPRPCSPMCGSTRTTPFCASPICRARRRRPRSICQPVEGPRAAGDARAQRVPAHRRTALCRDAAALRLLLVPARRASPSRLPKRDAVPREITTLVLGERPEFAAGRAANALRSNATCCRLPAGAPLVRRQGAAACRPPRSRPSFRSNARGLALVFVGVPSDAARAPPAICCRSPSAGRASPSVASARQRHRRRAPRPRTRARCSMPPPIRISSRRCSAQMHAGSSVGAVTHRLECRADQRVCADAEALDKIAVTEPRAVQHHASSSTPTTC